MSEWIPVEKRLPKDGVSVLCRIMMECDFWPPNGLPYTADEPMICEGYYRRRSKRWYRAVKPDIFCAAGTVTHWMPLPDPPEKEDK